MKTLRSVLIGKVPLLLQGAILREIEMENIYATCHICGEGGNVFFHGFKRVYMCQCEICGAAVYKDNKEKTAESFKEGHYDNVSACPVCKAETAGLAVHTNIYGSRVACSCGVSAGYGHDAEEALNKWNALFA